MPLPKPPVSNMTDFVVFCFVSIVAFILCAATLGVFADAILDPKGDRSGLIGALADICTTLIGALVGFVAGKGAGATEARESEDERRRQDIEAAKKQ